MIQNKKTIFIRILTTSIVILIIGFIFWQSMKPATESSTESGRVVAFLNKLCLSLGLGSPFNQGFVRTCAHFTEFGVLGSALCFMYNSYINRLKSTMLLSITSFTVISVSDEIIQLFSPGRTFQLKDIIIDISGALIFSLITLLLLKVIYNKKHKT